MNNVGTIAIGLKCPIVHPNDDIYQLVIDTVDNNPFGIDNNDVIAITESIVARANNQYCTVDDIAKSVKQYYPGVKELCLYEPIASRNRFSLILKGIARAMDMIQIIWDNPTDEVGNLLTDHPVTKLNYKNYYKELCIKEGCDCYFIKSTELEATDIVLDCRCHFEESYSEYTLQDLCRNKSRWGLLGSNQAGPELLKLFPDDCFNLVTKIHNYYWETKQIDVHCLVYGDGAYKDPVTGIWEFADPTTSPGYTSKLADQPNELKLKLLADKQSDEEVIKAIKNKPVNEQQLGTTPRTYKDLLASLSDLVSGSGDKGTPIVLIKNYFNNYATELK